MARYSIGIKTLAAAGGTALLEIEGFPLLSRAGIRRISIDASLAAGTSEVALIRSTAVGTNKASHVFNGINLNPNTPALLFSTSLVRNDWTAAPTIAATPIYLTRSFLSAVAGTPVVWEFDEDRLLWTEASNSQNPTPQSVLLWNPAAGASPVLNVTLEWEE